MIFYIFIFYSLFCILTCKVESDLLRGPFLSKWEVHSPSASDVVQPSLNPKLRPISNKCESIYYHLDALVKSGWHLVSTADARTTFRDLPPAVYFSELQFESACICLRFIIGDLLKVY